MASSEMNHFIKETATLAAAAALVQQATHGTATLAALIPIRADLGQLSTNVNHADGSVTDTRSMDASEDRSYRHYSNRLANVVDQRKTAPGQSANGDPKNMSA
jgi:hypothetical protein